LKEGNSVTSESQFREEKIAREIEALLGKIKPVYDQCIKDYPPDDLRITLFGAPGNSLHMYLLQLSAAIDTLCQISWWQKSHGMNRPNQNDLKALQNLDNMMKLHVFVGYFSQVEWSFRILLPFIKVPSAGIKMTDPWKVVYDYTFKILNLQKFGPLYDISRLLRNCIHSNGHHLDKNGSNYLLDWRGRKFEFVHSKPVTFATHENLLFIFEELFQSTMAILDAEIIKAIPHIKNEFHVKL
jgi:hypothetical protein